MPSDVERTVQYPRKSPSVTFDTNIENPNTNTGDTKSTSSLKVIEQCCCEKPSKTKSNTSCCKSSCGGCKGSACCKPSKCCKTGCCKSKCKSGCSKKSSCSSCCKKPTDCKLECEEYLTKKLSETNKPPDPCSSWSFIKKKKEPSPPKKAESSPNVDSEKLNDCYRTESRTSCCKSGSGPGCCRGSSCCKKGNKCCKSNCCKPSKCSSCCKKEEKCEPPKKPPTVKNDEKKSGDKKSNKQKDDNITSSKQSSRWCFPMKKKEKENQIPIEGNKCCCGQHSSTNCCKGSKCCKKGKCCKSSCTSKCCKKSNCCKKSSCTSTCCKKKDCKKECEELLVPKIKAMQEDEKKKKPDKKRSKWRLPKVGGKSIDKCAPKDEIQIVQCDELSCSKKHTGSCSSCCQKSPRSSSSGISLKPKPSDTMLACKSTDGEASQDVEESPRGRQMAIRGGATVGGALSLGALLYAIYYFLMNSWGGDSTVENVPNIIRHCYTWE